MVALACGGHAKAPAAAPVPPKEAAAPVSEGVHERIVPHTCAERTKLAQLMGRPAAPHAPTLMENPDSAPPPTSMAGGTKLAGNQAYRVVAPATVLIRTEHGMGTG